MNILKTSYLLALTQLYACNDDRLIHTGYYNDASLEFDETCIVKQMKENECVAVLAKDKEWLVSPSKNDSCSAWIAILYHYHASEQLDGKMDFGGKHLVADCSRRTMGSKICSPVRSPRITCKPKTTS